MGMIIIFFVIGKLEIENKVFENDMIKVSVVIFVDNIFLSSRFCVVWVFDNLFCCFCKEFKCIVFLFVL